MTERYPKARRRMALNRVKQALFHLTFEEKVKVLVATLKNIGAKGVNLEDTEHDQKESDTN